MLSSVIILLEIDKGCMSKTSIPVRCYNDPYTIGNTLKEYIHPAEFVGVAMIGDYIAFAGPEMVICFPNLPKIADDLIFLFDSVHPVKITLMLDDQRSRWLRAYPRLHCHSLLDIKDIVEKSGDPSLRDLYNDEVTFLNEFMHPRLGRPPSAKTVAVTMATRAFEMYQEIRRHQRETPSHLTNFDSREIFTTVTLLNSIFLDYKSLSLDELLDILDQIRNSKEHRWNYITKLSIEEQVELLNTLVQMGFLVFSNDRYSIH